MLWLEAYHCRNIVLQHLHSALDAESPSFRCSFTNAGRRPHDHSSVGMLVYDPSSLSLGVKSLRLRCCQAGGYGQRSGSGKSSSQS